MCKEGVLIAGRRFTCEKAGDDHNDHESYVGQMASVTWRGPIGQTEIEYNSGGMIESKEGGVVANMGQGEMG